MFTWFALVCEICDYSAQFLLAQASFLLLVFSPAPHQYGWFWDNSKTNYRG